VEISLPSLRRGEKKLRQAGVTNVRLLQMDARALLWAMCEAASVHDVYINFPDPWPKARHHHRRLVQNHFLHLLATRMMPAGKLEIATDHAEYAAVIGECLEQTPTFDSQLPATFVTEDQQRYQTKYELAAIREGRCCHYFKWQRNNLLAPDIFPIPKEFPMPHVVLQIPLSLVEIKVRYQPERDQPDRASANGVHVNWMQMFHSQDEQKLLVETYVKEEPVSQQFGLLIRYRRPGEVVIGLHEIGFPRPTMGIQVAIWHLANWIVGLHPEAKIVTHNCSARVMERTR
jgi:tRNA (guanine-N7-)-methyltransferase